MPKLRSLLGRTKQLTDVSPEQTASSQQMSGPAPKNEKVFHTGIKTLYKPEAAIAEYVDQTAFRHGVMQTWLTMS